MAVAVVGIAALLPGSSSAEEWIKATEPAFSAVPKGRWPREAILSDVPGAPDTVPTAIGAFLPAGSGRDHGLFQGEERLDDVFHFTASIASKLAAYASGKTSFTLAHLALPCHGLVEQVTAEMLGQPSAGHPRDRHQAGLVGHRVAQELGFEGPRLTLDAACASGLYGVKIAMEQLRRGEVRTAIAVSVNAADSYYLFHGFAQLRALSGTGQSRPLDARADGLLVGEGAAGVALKRVEDALADGDTIHAIILDGALGNDGRKGNLLAPDPAGQAAVMKAAWAGHPLKDLGYIECHSTGTPLGDGVELSSITELLKGSGAKVALASAKALIGHTVTTAGMAALIRAVGAVRDNLRPAMPADFVPRPELINHENLIVLSEPAPFEGARLAAVSAFGFGGTDAHLLVQAMPKAEFFSPPVASRRPGQLAIVSVAGRIADFQGVALAKQLVSGESFVGPTSPAVLRGLSGPKRSAALTTLHVDCARLKIPPNVARELLPQHLLSLQLAADALQQVPNLNRETLGCVMGMEVDPQIAEFVARARAPERADELSAPLDASVVQGHLPNFVANRVASRFDLKGPSFSVSAGPASLFSALHTAFELLSDPELTGVVVGAVDLATRFGLDEEKITGDAGLSMVVVRLSDANALGLPVLATVGPAKTGAQPESSRWGDLGAAAGVGHLLGVWRAGAEVALEQQWCGQKIAFNVAFMEDVFCLAPVHPGNQEIARSLGMVAAPRYDGPWEDVYCPVAKPNHPTSSQTLPVSTTSPDSQTWSWSYNVKPPTKTVIKQVSALDPQVFSVPVSTGAESIPLVAPIEAEGMPTLCCGVRRAPPFLGVSLGASLGANLQLPPQPPAEKTAVSGPRVGAESELSALVRAFSEHSNTIVRLHDQFLQQQAAQQAQLEPLLRALEVASGGTPPKTALPKLPVAASIPAPPVVLAPPQTAPRQVFMNRAGLLAHAGGLISEAFDSSYSNLDSVRPRVRMPMPPMLLCSRVVSIDATRGEFGPCGIVTEYDLPVDEDYPGPCVIIESGQADLLLVSYLGIDDENQGKRIYRLLDCDLTFMGERPAPGETLRHDIRIDRFVRMGEKTLFYFQYDCKTTSGRPILQMRNGCAGFFTPAELANPSPMNAAPVPGPQQQPLLSWRSTPSAWSDEVVAAVRQQRWSDAFGWQGADGAGATLPSAPWCLVHRVPKITTSGGPYGLGEVLFEQDLKDDDWFNPVHFVDDPCMPGTLMFDGCTQALQLWWIAKGLPAAGPGTRFDPLPGATAKLRCRGQVVPGQSKLTYHAMIREAGLHPSPWVKADVVLSVDGKAVVRAEDVCVGVVGEIVEVAAEDPAVEGADAVSKQKVLEYSVGSSVAAFGPAYAGHDGQGTRCARMPGPPYLTMSRVVSVQGEANKTAAPRTVEIAYDVPEDAWYFRAVDGTMPYAVLLETALQPCGWITAWQGQGIKGKEPLSFRNLGGSSVQLREVRKGDGPLITRATQTSVAASGGLQVQFFEIVTSLEDGTPVFTCETHFGYFTAAALDGQRGLSLTPMEIERSSALKEVNASISLSDSPCLPREDWRMLHRVVHTNPTGGAAGLGVYAAETDVHPAQWFFTAHFYLDPVMPGSLGLEALLQLSRWVWERQMGPVGAHQRVRQTVPLNETVKWLYRGQVRTHIEVMRCELEVLSVDQNGVRCSGVVFADGLPIYRFEDFGVEVVDAFVPKRLVAPVRDTPVSALIDRVVDEQGAWVGELLLDPAVHPWLSQHCPTVTVPAVPMAFAIEIAVEAATLASGRPVRGVPTFSASAWIAVSGEPLKLQIVAVVSGDVCAVSLAVWQENERFSKLSGYRVHMKGVVELGELYEEAPAPLAVPQRGYEGTAKALYEGGHLFHGPVLQSMKCVNEWSPEGTTATLLPTDDEALLGLSGRRLVVDALLIDAATHPMMSGSPEVWVSGLKPGKLAYPVSCEGLKIYTDRPTGEVIVRTRCVKADEQQLVFDVQLVSDEQVYLAYQWVEALTDAGPVLGRPANQRRAFLWEEEGVAEVTVGVAYEQGWLVKTSDLVEPLVGTLIRQYCSKEEVMAVESSGNIREESCRVLAVKEAARLWLRQRAGLEVHPKSLVGFALREDWWVVDEAPTLTAQQFVDHLAPVRWKLKTKAVEGGFYAFFERNDERAFPPF